MSFKASISIDAIISKMLQSKRKLIAIIIKKKIMLQIRNISFLTLLKIKPSLNEYVTNIFSEINTNLITLKTTNYGNP